MANLSRLPAPDSTVRESPASTGPVFKPVRTRRAFEVVCDLIRTKLSLGELKPGDRLPGEVELAEQFKISRSSVKEAIRSLEATGIVEARTGVNGGFFIQSGPPVTIQQVVRDMVSLGQVSTASVTEARIELMCSAIRLASKRITEAELDEIEADIDFHTLLFRQGRGSRNSGQSLKFYQLIARATHNEVVFMLVDALSQILLTLLARIDPKPSEDMIKVRRKVLYFMRQRDADRACAVMTTHLKRVNEYLESESKRHGKRTPSVARRRSSAV